MSRKKEGAPLAPEKPRVDEAVENRPETPENPGSGATEKVGTTEVGITGLPVEEQRKNLIKVAIFVIGAAALIAVLKFSLGW